MRARSLSQARRRQPRLGARALEQPVAEGQDLLGDRAQELRAALRGERGVRLERPLGRPRGGVDVARRVASKNSPSSASPVAGFFARNGARRVATVLIGRPARR